MIGVETEPRLRRTLSLSGLHLHPSGLVSIRNIAPGRDNTAPP